MTSAAWPASLPTPVICIRLWNKCLELIHTKSHFKHGWRALAIAESVMNSGFKSVTPGKQRSGRKSRRVSCSKFQILTSKNLMTFGSLILKVKYRLLHSFSQPLTNATLFVFHLWLRGCLTNWAGPFFFSYSAVSIKGLCFFYIDSLL